MRTLWSAFLIAILSGCSGRNSVPVVVYSPHGKEMLSAFATEFEAAHPGVQVQWLDMGSQDAYDRIRTERDNPQADVWWGAPSTEFARAERDGLLEKYVPSWDSAEPVRFKSSGGYWYGTFLTPDVIMYNTRLVSRNNAPHDWQDLLAPRWRDKIIIRYPLASGTMRVVFCAILERELRRTGSVDSGFAWLTRLDANTKSYASDPTQLYLRIAREEGEITIWDLPDIVLQTDKNHYPFGYIIPAGGTPLVTDCIAIVKGAPHPDRAKEFYEFVTTRAAFLRQARDFYRIPTRTDLPRQELPDWIASLQLKEMPVDWDLLAAHEQEWMKRWDDEVRGRGREEGF